MARDSRQTELFASDGRFSRLGDVERWARSNHFHNITGTDEAGRGPLAGPVVAAAVILPPALRLEGLDDSKRLTERRRERLFFRIRTESLSWAAAFGFPDRIDRMNILHASLDAMARAVSLAESRRGTPSDLIVVDGNQTLPLVRVQRAVVGGDGLCRAVAAASIVAKVLRDRWMTLAAGRWPEYGFERHKGYPTKAHKAAIQEYGPCAIHRKTFRGVREWLDDPDSGD